MRDSNLQELRLTETEWLDAERRKTGQTEVQVRNRLQSQPWTFAAGPSLTTGTGASDSFLSQYVPVATQAYVPPSWR